MTVSYDSYLPQSSIWNGSPVNFQVLIWYQELIAIFFDGDVIVNVQNSIPDRDTYWEYHSSHTSHSWLRRYFAPAWALSVQCTRRLLGLGVAEFRKICQSRMLNEIKAVFSSSFDYSWFILQSFICVFTHLSMVSNNAILNWPRYICLKTQFHKTE